MLVNGIVLIFLILISQILSRKKIDLLASHCVHGQIAPGLWTFSETTQDKTESILHNEECAPDAKIPILSTVTFNLTYPSIVTNVKTGSSGTWTMVIDNGLEIRIDDKRYIVFFKYHKSFFGHITSYCDQTWVGFFHEDVTTNPQHWGCVEAKKESSSDVRMTHAYQEKVLDRTESGLKFGVSRPAYGFRVESARRHVDFFAKFRLSEEQEEKIVDSLPTNYDWRNVSGKDYVSKVTNQAECGSCYIFSVIGMLDSRARIASQLAYEPKFSPQDVIDCGSPTCNGCGGGLPFLVGKFLGEWGIVDNHCIPYYGFDAKCVDAKCSERHWVSSYGYVGGYFGGASVAAMMQEIYANGPIAVAFYVEEQFIEYEGGVYVCSQHGPFDADHAVLIVGWGSNSTDSWWIVKNSWGRSWGLKGYFYIRRGNNDCNIETSPSFASLKFSNR